MFFMITEQQYEEHVSMPGDPSKNDNPNFSWQELSTFRTFELSYPLHAAAFSGNAFGISQQLAAGENPNGQDFYRRRPLEYVGQNDDRTWELLISAGADPTLCGR